MTTRTIKAVEGRSVRDPDDRRQRPIPDDGKAVSWSSYWQRALDAGDVALVEGTKASKIESLATAPPPPPLPAVPPAATAESKG